MQKLMGRLMVGLPFLILLSSFIARLLFYYFKGTEYWIDEMIVTEISKYDLIKIFKIIKAEPHPPGFYLLLKLFPVDNVFFTKVYAMLISFLLNLLILIFGTREKIIQKYNLSIGLSLFFSSYTFLELTSHVRHEIISFPLFFLYFLVALKLFQDNSKFKVKTFILLNILVSLLLFFGYIYYLIALSVTFLISVRLIKNRVVKYILSLQILLMVVYLFSLGFQQIQLNAGRFAWFTQQFNSLFRALSTHLTGVSFAGFIPDIVSGLFLIFVLLSKGFMKKPQQKRVFYFLILLSVVIIVISYPFYFFIRTRFSAPLFFIASIFAGWGANRLIKRRLLLLCLVIFFLTIGLSSYQTLNTGGYRRWLADIINKQSQETRYGLLDDHPNFPFIFKLSYNLTNITPVNVYFPRVFEGLTDLNENVLKLEGKSFTLSDRQVRENLSKNGLENYFYIMRTEDDIGFFDPRRQFLKVLEESCASSSVIPVHYKLMVFNFKGCKFD